MAELYEINNGELRLRLHSGQTRVWDSTARFTFMLAGTQSGKALAVDTPIPTPDGFKAMGDLRVGDTVFDDRGLPCTVTFATPVMYGHSCYEVVFDDGATIIADADHLWLTQTAKERKNEVRRVANPNPSWATRPQSRPTPDSGIRTTAEIARTLQQVTGKTTRSNHSIELTSPVAYPERDLPIPPYTLGAWLGDGFSNGPMIVVGDPEIADEIRAEGVKIEPATYDGNVGNATLYRLGTANGKGSRNPFTQLLNGLGVRNNKHIPAIYLTASPEQRLALLQGLMDTDGYAGKIGTCEFTTVDPQLAQDFMQLAQSLGIKARAKESRSTMNGKDCGTKYRIFFTTQVPVFRLPRKLERQKLVEGRRDTTRRFIVEARSIHSVPVRCIQVDSPSHLYLAGKDYIVTHNTSFGPWWLNEEIDRNGPGDYLAVTSTYDLFNLKMLPEMLRVFCRILGRGKFYAGAGIIEIADPNGKFWAKRATDDMWARIIMRSASAGGGLESSTAKAAWLDEVGQDGFPLEAWEAVLRRLSLHQGRVLGTTTLYNTGWLKQQIYDKWVAGDADYNCVQYASTVNPAFPMAEYLRAKRSMPAWKFKMFYRGEFDRPPGLIYSDYSEDIHMIDPIPLPGHWPRYIGIDPGGVNLATLWAAENPTTNVIYVYRETLEGSMTTAEHVEKAKERAQDQNVVMWVGGAPSEDQVRRDWAENGIVIQRPTVTEVWPGIDRAISLFKTKRIRIFNTLSGLRDELGTYSRVLDKQGEPTTDIKDKRKFHRLDALRYMASGIKEIVDISGTMPADMGAGTNMWGPLGDNPMDWSRLGQIG